MLIVSCRGEPGLSTGAPVRLFRRTYGTIPSSARSASFPRETENIPGTPPLERSTKASATRPIEARAPPSFAKLTHLDDGSPMQKKEAIEPMSNEVDPPEQEEEDADEIERRKRLPRASQDPDYNPWEQ